MENLNTEIPVEQEAPPAEPSVKPMRFLVDILETLILSVILFIGINAVTARIRVDGSSMEPSLHNNEYVIVNKWAYKFGSPQRGDVVVFRFPRDTKQEYIKRIIGLPGDMVSISDQKVFVNGKLLEEVYINDDPSYQGNWAIPDHQIFVLGDNRNNSSDSHVWGPVSLDYVIGKAMVVYWPPTSLRGIDHVTSILP